MSNTKDWKLCFEVGLNHLGCYNNLEKIIAESRVQEIPCAISVQIREENFTKKIIKI